MFQHLCTSLWLQPGAADSCRREEAKLQLMLEEKRGFCSGATTFIYPNVSSLSLMKLWRLKLIHIRVLDSSGSMKLHQSLNTETSPRENLQRRSDGASVEDHSMFESLQHVCSWAVQRREWSCGGPFVHELETMESWFELKNLSWQCCKKRKLFLIWCFNKKKILFPDWTFIWTTKRKPDVITKLKNIL